MEAYQCETCGQSVPLCNKLLHSLRCAKVNSELKTTPTSTSTTSEITTIDDSKGPTVLENCVPSKSECIIPSFPASSWNCLKCNFSNISDDSNCFACSNSKFDAVVVDEAFPLNSWTCTACTLVNSKGRNYCEVCCLPRPPDKVKRERLIPTDEELDLEDSNDVNPSSDSGEGNLKAELNAELVITSSTLAGLMLSLAFYLRGRRIKTINPLTAACSGAGIGAIASIGLLWIWRLFK